jgi:hypothetical protein
LTEAGSNLSGTLTVTDGVNTANITLLGQYTASQFTSASDGHGGIVIGDPTATPLTRGPGAVTVRRQGAVTGFWTGASASPRLPETTSSIVPCSCDT